MNRIATFIAASIIVAAPALANLGTINVNYNGALHGGSVNGGTSLSGTIRFQESGFSVNSATGLGVKLGDPFGAFCIDLEDNISGGDNPISFEVVDLADAPDGNGFPPPGGMGTERANRIAELWGRSHGDIAAANAGQQRKRTAAAFQLAVWEIVYDTDVNNFNYDVDSGTFSTGINGSVRNLAQAMLNQLDGTGPTVQLAGLTNANVQDFVAPVIPAPGAVLLGIIGMGVIGWIKRR